MSSPLNQAIKTLNTVLLGKEHQVKLSLACLLARGHLLIEDIPGLGKTTLSHALANCLGLSYNRIQFTSDLLPSDLLGINIFDKNKAEFVFHPGPVFSQIVLADEINRATPKAQSALLEAMEERQVTVEGVTRPLPLPFFVIATQNPLEQSGTYPLPESQLDRFLMRISLGYPSPVSEKELLLGVDRRDIIKELSTILTYDTLVDLQKKVDNVTATEPLIDYIQRIILFTRENAPYGHGLSPRGGLALLKASKAWALVDGRNSVLPDDVQAVLPSVVEHRLGSSGSAINQTASNKIIQAVDIF
ncbi:AAA family ATPase [Alkalimarinus alittae]|uniref:MoxR family ATPase n=1 Tax=Alkalimarinus alittae TaxID=2961619 RepID=A0ABY6N767_9ALTE|nr:MoxR family ATPase [Alkalimarinus alittae]UZE97941.1 MoxR family ATPase [Alkalimarinus alittae]